MSLLLSFLLEAFKMNLHISFSATVRKTVARLLVAATNPCEEFKLDLVAGARLKSEPASTTLNFPWEITFEYSHFLSGLARHKVTTCLPLKWSKDKK